MFDLVSTSNIATSTLLLPLTGTYQIKQVW
jgi:hypothetical protein